MGNRIFVAVVVLLWGTTMSWLLMDKILPPFFFGNPPARGVVVDEEPIIWEISYGERPVGYAVRQTVPGVDSTTEVISRVVLRELPLRRFAPHWMGSLLAGIDLIQLDSRTRIVLDSFGNLSCFDSKVQINDLPPLVRIFGTVDGADLRLRFVSSELTHEVRYPLPKTSMFEGELVPQPNLLQVYVGRTWQTEVFSPLRPSTDVMELLQAEVVAEETIPHNGDLPTTRRIEYRSMSSAGVSSEHTLRATVWVAEDGTVLRHDVHLLGAVLRFNRRNDPQMIAMARDLLDLEVNATVAPLGRDVDD